MPQVVQNKSNYIRRDPAFHLSLLPGSMVIFLWAVSRVVRHLNGTTVIEAALALLLVWAIFLSRIYAMRVQDRVIRLEERLRLAALLPQPLAARIHDLTLQQLIALRFASDRELPALVQRALDENLSGAQIKDGIQDWRGDYLRV